jgi:ribosomal protein S18 acetylase RimI-like enzyme
LSRSIGSALGVGLHDVRIRPARLADASRIAEVHVRAWHETYRGLVPEKMLAAFSIEESTRMWRSILATSDTTILVAEYAAAVSDREAEHGKADGRAVVGFGCAGPSRELALGTTGEVSAIYLLNAVKRRGLGRALLTGLMRALAADGHRSAGLWVLADNAPARQFYEAAGGRTSAMREVEHSTAVLREVAYVWADLAADQLA